MTYERDNIARMRGYTYGEQPERPGIVKLNTNENPYPPSPAVAAALGAFDVNRLRTYPNALAADFRAAAAELHGLSADNVMATNGGDEALRLAITTFVDPGATFASLTPSYSLYPVLASVQDCRQVEIPLAPDFAWPQDLAGQLNAADAHLTCIVNPHAPSGRLLPAADVAELAADMPGVLLIDEAYVDFVDPASDHDLTRLLADVPNLLLLRSMSKGYSLAGLRYGYLLGHVDLIRPILEKTRDSYNVDAIAQTLATAALTDQDYARANWTQIRSNRAVLAAALKKLGFDIPESHTNFLLARAPANANAATLYEALRGRDIFVRYFTDLPDRLRISVGTPEENAALVEALADLLQ